MMILLACCLLRRYLKYFPSHGPFLPTLDFKSTPSRAVLGGKRRFKFFDPSFFSLLQLRGLALDAFLERPKLVTRQRLRDQNANSEECAKDKDITPLATRAFICTLSS
jgi:hypothetical protein